MEPDKFVGLLIKEYKKTIRREARIEEAEQKIMDWLIAIIDELADKKIELVSEGVKLNFYISERSITGRVGGLEGRKAFEFKIKEGGAVFRCNDFSLAYDLVKDNNVQSNIIRDIKDQILNNFELRVGK